MNTRSTTGTDLRFGRFLQRGESTIASVGLLFAVILLCAMAASAWWSAREHRARAAEARTRELEAAGSLLGETARTLLARDEVSALRRVVTEAARGHELTDCRVVLPSGQVIAAARASDITLASLPEAWPVGPLSPIPNAPSGQRAISFPIDVPSRGAARVDVWALATPSVWSYWDTQAGIGVIGALALGALLLLYRRMRERMRALSFIRESLLALDSGETELAALTIQRDLGAEAAAWNELLAERERLQQVLVTKRLLELPAARRERSHDLASMCDAMSQGLILVDSNLLVTYANGAASLYLGRAREEVLGNKVEGLLDDADVLEAVRNVAGGRVRRSTSVEIRRTTDGAVGVLRFSVRPVRRDDESAAMIVIEDVTQQRLADDSRNTFVAQVTHELRTPLTNILLYAETAMEEGETDEHIRANSLNIISQEARRLDRIVGDMLSVAELEAGSHTLRIDDVPLMTVFSDLRADYEASAREKSITFTVDLPPKLPTLQADKDKIELALHNLVGNAMKYTTEGGRVTVRVDATEESVTVRVEDTGIGMAADDLERVFDKFYRAKDERVSGITGSGLGLALAREVIRLHGGEITVESELNEGSTFVLTVPVMAHAM